MMHTLILLLENIAVVTRQGSLVSKICPKSQFSVQHQIVKSVVNFRHICEQITPLIFFFFLPFCFYLFAFLFPIPYFAVSLGDWTLTIAL